MEGRNAAADGSEVRFNHGLAVSEGRPDIDVTVTALRRAVGRANDADDAEVLDRLFQRLVRTRQYTEGHHPVRLELTETEVNYLRLAHLIAADSCKAGDDDIVARFSENRERLPTLA